MASIKRTAFALLALAIVSGCELLPIEDPAEVPGALAEACTADMARVKRAVETYTIKGGPDAPVPTEVLLVQQELLSEPAKLANILRGQVVPVSDCVTPLAEAAEAAAAASGTTTTIAAPAPAPADASTTTAPAAPVPPADPCAADYQALNTARDAFIARYGGPPSSEAQLVGTALLAAEVARWDLTATGDLVAAPESGC